MPINAPKITGGATRSVTVDEGQITVLNSIGASDADGDTLNYKIVGGLDKSKFKIDANGKLTFIGAQDFEKPLDSNKDGTYQVIVQVADGPLSSGTTLKTLQTITVTLADVEAVTQRRIAWWRRRHYGRRYAQRTGRQRHARWRCWRRYHGRWRWRRHVHCR